MAQLVPLSHDSGPARPSDHTAMQHQDSANSSSRAYTLVPTMHVENPSGEDVEFDFPRSTRPEHLCLTDYFGDDDIVAFQSVTVGTKVADVLEKWNDEDKYSDAYYLHGLAVELAEALAQWVNVKIKSELGLDKGGLRYSWGFPSCPDVSQHHLVWKLLQPEKSGMTITESGQIIPEQSTAAIVIHHPNAQYFVI